MKHEELIKIFEDAGVNCGSGNWADYEIAKEAIGEYEFNLSEYDEAIRLACDYVGV